MKRRVLFLDEVHESLAARLSMAGFCLVHDYRTNYADLLASVADYEGVVLRSRLPIDADFLQAAKGLRWIARSGSGLENIDLVAAQQRGVHVLRAPEGNAPAVAEHVLGMMLAGIRHFLRADAQVRAGQWLREANRGTELAGRTMAIIGYGHVGSKVAQLLAALGMRVLVLDPYKRVPVQAGVEQVQDWTPIFEEADFLSLHVNLTAQTHQMITADCLAQFKKPLFFINTARGECVKTADLLDFLQDGRLVFAALDVLDLETKTFNQLQRTVLYEALMQQSNVLLTPHIAGWTRESYRRMADILLEKISALG